MNNERDDEHPGFLFVLEGIDGAGKTAVVDALVKLLSQDHAVVRLREPTNESQWEILHRNRMEIGTPEPNIIFILDVSVEVGLERALQRSGTKNEQFEQADRLIKVREAYLAMTREDDGMYVIVDAARTLEEVTSEVYSEIVRYIGNQR